MTTPQKQTIAIIERVAGQHGIPVERVLSADRYWPVAKARREAINAVAVERPHLSSTQIGRTFNRDYTTILFNLGRLSGKKPRIP